MSQFVNGRRWDGSSGTAADFIDPSSGTLVAIITMAGPDDVDEAVQAPKFRTPDGPGPRPASAPR